MVIILQPYFHKKLGFTTFEHNESSVTIMLFIYTIGKQKAVQLATVCKGCMFFLL